MTGPTPTSPTSPTTTKGAPVPTFETTQPIALSIEASQAAVHLIAADRTDTVVSVNPSDSHRREDVEAAEKTTVDLANGTLTIKQRKPGGIAAPVIGWKRSGSIDVTVELPEGSSLRAHAGLGEFRVDGALGDVEVRTGAGDVRLDRTGPLRIRTGTGTITVEEAAGRADIVAAGELAIGAVTGDADIKNINGRTWVGRAGGDVKVKSANGDVTIDDAGRDVAVKTAQGSIRLGQVARGTVSVETAAGGLDIGVRDGTAAWVDATTRFGRLHNDLTPSDNPAATDETVEVHARTAFGNIRIARSAPTAPGASTPAAH